MIALTEMEASMAPLVEQLQARKPLKSRYEAEAPTAQASATEEGIRQAMFGYRRDSTKGIDPETGELRLGVKVGDQ